MLVIFTQYQYAQYVVATYLDLNGYSIHRADLFFKKHEWLASGHQHVRLSVDPTNSGYDRSIITGVRYNDADCPIYNYVALH